MSGEEYDRMALVPSRPQAHIWVRDGRPTLTIITNAPAGGMHWPDDSGPLLLFDDSFDVTVTVVQP